MDYVPINPVKMVDVPTPIKSLLRLLKFRRAPEIIDLIGSEYRIVTNRRDKSVLTLPTLRRLYQSKIFVEVRPFKVTTSIATFMLVFSMEKPR